MKNFGILAVALAHLAFALPQGRRVVYDTVTEEVFETVYTTTTMWVDPTAAPSSAPALVGGFYENNSRPSSVSVAAPRNSALAPAPAAAAAPAPVQSAPASSSAPAAPVYQAPAPAPITSAAPASVAPVAAVPSSVATPPAPVSSEPAAAPAAAPAPVAAAPAPLAYSAPAAQSSSASTPASTGSGGTGDHTGDITYYDVSVGTGSCGTTASNADNVVALSHLDMNNGANPNNNPLCGKTINIYYNGATHQAKVFDTCPTCAEGSLDLTQDLFNAVAPSGDGRVHGVSWSFA